MTDACYPDLPDLIPDPQLLGEDVYISAPQPPKRRHRCKTERSWFAPDAQEGARFGCGKCGQWWIATNKVVDSAFSCYAEGLVVWQRSK